MRTRCAIVIRVAGRCTGRRPGRVWSVACVLGAAVCLVTAAEAASPATSLNLQWGEDYDSFRFQFRGTGYEYPEQFVQDTLPPIGQPPRFDFEEKWPIVTMRARWSISGQGWPEAYRGDAIDLILMFACDANQFSQNFPKSIRDSGFTAPPEFHQAANDQAYDLATMLRGARAEYQFKASAGFGAADYKMRTELRVGTGTDARTVFYYDKPSYISEHLENREVIFTGWDAGDSLHFEFISICVCKPRSLFRGEALKRVKGDCQYLVDAMYQHLDNPPTKQELDDFFREVRKKHRQFPIRPAQEPIPPDEEAGQTTDPETADQT